MRPTVPHGVSAPRSLPPRAAPYHTSGDTLTALLQAVAAPVDAPAWGALGIGGVLATVMFYFYRLDRKSSEDRLNGIIQDFRSIIEANTKAMTSLEKAIEERRHE